MDKNTIQLPEEENLDLKKYIFIILYYWWWFAITIFISLTIAYLINRYTKEIYQVNCSVIVHDETSQMGSIENMLSELGRVRNSKRKATVVNEISVLKSYSLAHKTLQELDFDITYTAVGRRGIAESRLYNNSPFIVIPDTSRPNLKSYPIKVTLLSQDKYRLEINDVHEINQELRFGVPYVSDDFNFKVIMIRPEIFNKPEYFPRKYIFQFNNLNKMANHYKSALSIGVNDEKGSILTISLQGEVSAQIADYLNKLCEIYIRSDLEEKNAVSKSTIEFIDEQLSEIIDSLQSAEIRLQNFRVSNRVTDISTEGTYFFQQLEELQAAQAVLEINENYYDYLLEYLQNTEDRGDVVAPSVIGIADPLLNTLVSELNQLKFNKRRLSFSMKENNPELIVLEEQINLTTENLIENIRNAKATNELAIKNHDRRIEKVELQLKKLPFTERQLINFKREFDVNDQIYTFLLEKRAEAGITAASNKPDNKILDIARPENAILIKPKSSLNYTTALIIGALIPLIIIIISEYFNTKIVERKEIEKNTSVPIIGSVGHNERYSELPIVESPKSALAESFRTLRTNLQYINSEENQKVISISSTISGEGKTFIAVNLASILALAGKKTLLVGLDLRRPKIHKVFNLSNECGISTFLIGKNKFDEVVYSTNISHLDAATSGPIPPNPAELLGSIQMTEFMAKAREKYDMIVIDTPPIAVVSDALTIGGLIDTQIFVIRQKYSNRQVLKIVNEFHEQKKLPHLSIVVNDVQLSGYYRYGYKYGYDYGYISGYERGYYDDEDQKIIEKGNILMLFLRRLWKKH